MRNKKYICIVLIIFLALISVSAVSAADDASSDIISTDIDNEIDLEENILNEDVLTNNDNELILEEDNLLIDNEVVLTENDNELILEEDNLLIDTNEKTQLSESSVKTFTDLYNTINDNDNDTIYLSDNYRYTGFDSSYKKGITLNRELSIYGNGITIDGSHQARIFYVTNPNVKIYNITFINGNVSSNGGAISGQCTVINCTFINNIADMLGGAIYESNATNCTFINNIAQTGMGGAMYGEALYYGRTAINCTFIQNSAYLGGAIDSYIAINCSFINNSAHNSAGAIEEGIAINSSFINNTAHKGGAIYSGIAYNCSFINNTAHEGGAIYLMGDSFLQQYDDSFFAENSTFINNTAHEGGAIYFEGDVNYPLSVKNCTFINNTAVNGGGMYKGTSLDCNFIQNVAYEVGGAVYLGEIISSTFMLNLAGIEGPEGTYGYHYIGDKNIIVPSLIVANYTSEYGSGDKLIFDLRYDNETFDGNQITISVYQDDLFIGKYYGLSGEDGGWIVNLEPGIYNATLSYEYSSVAPVNITLTILESQNQIPGNGTSPRTFKDLNSIINDNINNDTIYLNDNYTFTNTDLPFYEGIIISRDLTIYGNGITIDGSNKARIFNVTNGNVKFINITFVNGFSFENGGAVYGGTAINCSFIENIAYMYYGGAMANGNAIESSFINNTAYAGGAMYESAAVNCTFIQNSADTGGAMSNSAAVNCTFIQNSAYLGGACRGGTANESTFLLNFASEGGSEDMFSTSTENCNFLVPTLSAKSPFSTYYSSTRKFVFNLTYEDQIFDGLNTEINVYQGDIFIATFNALTGEGLVLNLEPGLYNATLKVLNTNVAPINVILNISEKPVPKSFQELQQLFIDYVNNDTIYLEDDYAYDNNSDFDLIEGIVIDRMVTIEGDNHVIDGNHLSRIFNVSGANVTLKNINFVNGSSENNGASIYWGGANGTVNNCTFINNSGKYGGAIFWAGSNGTVNDSSFQSNNARVGGGAIAGYGANGTISNSSFQSNSADVSGGAIEWSSSENGNIVNCTFKYNHAFVGGATYWYFNGTVSYSTYHGNYGLNAGANFYGTALFCIFETDSDMLNYTDLQPAFMVSDFITTYGSGEKLLFNLSYEGKNYDGCNSSISISQDDNLIGTYYALSGEDGGWIVNLLPGTYNVTLDLVTYKANPVTIAMTINPISTSITVDSNDTINLTPGESKEILAELSPFANELIYSSSDDSIVSVDQTGKITALKVGEADITVSFVGNETHAPSEKVIHIVVEKINRIATKIIYADMNTGPVDTEKSGRIGNYFVVKLVDDNNNPVAGALIQIGFNGKIYNKTTDSVGDARLQINLKREDIYTFAICFVGDDNYEGAFEVAKITVSSKYPKPNKANATGTGTEVEPSEVNTRLKTSITYEDMVTTSVLKVDGRVGENFTITLKDNKGKALAGKQVQFGFNGHIYNKTTDANGKASLQINLERSDIYTFAVAYLGDSQYQAAFVAAKITVNKHPAKLTASAKTFKSSAKTKTVTATLKSANGNAIANKKISFTVNGKTYSATTNANGVASVKVSLTKNGTYTATAKFAGDSTIKATSTKFNIKIS